MYIFLLTYFLMDSPVADPQLIYAVLDQLIS